MNRKVPYLRGLIGFLVLLMAVPPWALAQGSGAAATYGQGELDQMLAPVALYPDSLLGQILVAATYPDQVAEADQWVRQNPNLQGDELNGALDRMNWDLSVKALVPFPQVLAMMSAKMDWTQGMGNAFLAQEGDVMDTIQRLRRQAHAAGHLNTTEQQRVVVRGESIEIVPANPRVIYVPAYNPSVIYGSWGYPSYPPYAYSPYYPNYAYDPYYTGGSFVTAGLFGFAAGIAVGSIWSSGWGHWDWGRRHANVTINRTININRNDIRRGDIRTSRWQTVRQGRLRSIEQTGRAADRAQINRATSPGATSVERRQSERRNTVQQGRTGRATDRAQINRATTPGATSVQKRQSERRNTVQQGRANRDADRGQINRGSSSGKSVGADRGNRGSGRGSRGASDGAGRDEGDSTPRGGGGKQR
ncbi:MAG: DUF3300 domain-containing protein [Syntrophobacteraceae bacterium]